MACVFSVGLLAAVFSAKMPAYAAYPDRPITMIVPFPPGGPTDTIARFISDEMTKSLGQQVVIDNRPGAAGNMGIAIAAQAKPDGYTLLLVSSGMAVSQSMYDNLKYDPVKDFEPVSLLVSSPSAVAVLAKSPIKDLAGLIATAKQKPGVLNYSSPGLGTKSHLTAERLKVLADIDIVHIPYSGSGPATKAVLEGTVDVGFLGLAPVEAQVQGGQFRALAVTGPKRWRTLPDVPTLVECGYPGFISESTQSLYVPAGTPKEIIAKVNKAVLDAFKVPRVRELVEKNGYEIIASTPEELKEHLVYDINDIKDTVKRANLKLK